MCRGLGQGGLVTGFFPEGLMAFFWLVANSLRKCKIRIERRPRQKKSYQSVGLLRVANLVEI